MEEHTFCFSFHKLRAWFLLVFALFTCITTHPVKTSNWFGQQFATLRLWVSFPLTETTQTEKAKDCVTVWRVSIIKLNFLDNFWLDFLHQFRNWFFLCKEKCSLLILGFVHSNKKLRGRNCRVFQLCFYLLGIWTRFLKLPAIFHYPGGQLIVFARRFHKIDDWLCSLHWITK